MAANRAQFRIDKSQSLSWQIEWIVASGTTGTIAMGTPTKIVTADASVAGVVVPMVDGDGSVTAMRFAGLSKNTSNETSTASGVVDTWCPIPGLLYGGAPLTASNTNTQVLINALTAKRVVFDLTASVWTVDTAAADALVNCVCIVGGNPATSEVFFYYSPKGTFLDTSTSM